MSDRDGVLLYFDSVPYIPEGYWKQTIPASNFERIGVQPYGIKCNSSKIGGAYVSYFSITGTGDEFDTPLVQWDLGVIVILSFFFVLCILGIIYLPGDSRDEEGKLISINSLKYFKYPLGGLAWGILLLISYLVMGITESYILSEGITLIFKTFFTILMISATIGIPVIFWFLFAKFMQDQVIKRMIDRNIMEEKY